MELVKLSDQSINGVPYTTADIIASYAQVSHKHINSMINKYKDRLERKSKLLFKKEVSGANPKKIYMLSERQATLLITFLKNTERVADFKEKLVDSFFKVRIQQNQRKMIYDFSKDISKQLGDAIKNNVEVNKFTYANFNKLVYKSAIGISTNQLRKRRNIPNNAEISTYLDIEEFKKVNNAKVKLVGLLNQNLSYQEIKERMTPKVINLDTVLS
ncbi:Rha family transcriptional regulator [Fructilactobacillus frigidiflavus]|uniref:Rha family transcriptional regulator n=1 Tax=Fructilactobacillus frigidiflavus TaxID=3242688 RepID=UPI003756706E